MRHHLRAVSGRQGPVNGDLDVMLFHCITRCNFRGVAGIGGIVDPTGADNVVPVGIFGLDTLEIEYPADLVLAG